MSEGEQPLRRALPFILLAGLCFSTLDATAKYLVQFHSLFLVVWARYAGQMLVLKFSRDEEREADLVGLDISARAGYDPRAGIALWRKMAALGKRTPLEILSTHPGGETRIADIESHMNVLLPLYARTKGTSAAKLPPYRTNVALR